MHCVDNRPIKGETVRWIVSSRSAEETLSIFWIVFRSVLSPFGISLCAYNLRGYLKIDLNLKQDGFVDAVQILLRTYTWSN